MAVAICGVVAALAAMWLKRASSDSTVVATTVLNRVGYALVLLSLAHLLTVEVAARRESATERQVQIDSAAVGGAPRNSENRPDIYYIVLDAYGRSDILKELYG